MTKNYKPEGWSERFDFRSDPENYRENQEGVMREPNDSLLDNWRYLESEFEFDKDRLKSFIDSELRGERNKVLDEAREFIENANESNFGSGRLFTTEEVLEMLEGLRGK